MSPYPTVYRCSLVLTRAIGSFATGWNYFLKYAIALPNNLTAAGIIIQYWRPDLNVAIFVATFTVAIVLVNVGLPNACMHEYFLGPST